VEAKLDVTYKFRLVTGYVEWIKGGNLWASSEVWVYGRLPRKITESFKEWRLSKMEYEADKARIDAELADFYKRAGIDTNPVPLSEEERQEIITAHGVDLPAEFTRKLYLNFEYYSYRNNHPIQQTTRKTQNDRSETN
jgi:hypothetical protein